MEMLYIWLAQWFALPRWICSDELWVTGFEVNRKNGRALVVQILCMSPAKQPSGLSYLSCTCKDYMCVCPASSLHTLHVPLNTLSMCVFAAFLVVFNAPKRPFDIPVEFLCQICVLCKIVSVFSRRRSHYWPLIRLWGLENVNSHHDFNKRERLGWHAMDHLCDFPWYVSL